jgi:hypothetical protein
VSGPATGPVGTPFNFTVTVSKSGTLDAVNAVLNCGLTGTVTGVPQRGNFSFCTFGATSVSCSPTTLGSGSFDVVITVNPTTPVANSCSCNVSSDTVDNSPGNNSDSDSVGITQLAPDWGPVEIDTSFTSRLELPPPDGSVRGQVLLNGTALHETNNAAPFRHHLNGQKGRNTMEARLVAGTGEGQWVFNFAGAPHFVDGSLAVESGQVIAQGSDRIVFRVSPSSPPIRFRLRLSE